MKGITHVFFDLDHTLWDHDANAKKVLEIMYEKFDLGQRSSHSRDVFLTIYKKVNDQLWDDYNHGRIDREYLREQRFHIVLDALEISDHHDASAMGDFFLDQCPRQKGIIEGADLVLNYLQPKYGMSLITNGFDDVQQIKLQTSGLDKYFSHVFTSETTGAKKPDPKIFEVAMEKVGVKPHEAVMIGDNLKADVEGAESVGILPIFFNPLGAVRSVCEWQISHLQELLKIL